MNGTLASVGLFLFSMILMFLLGKQKGSESTKTRIQSDITIEKRRTAEAQTNANRAEAGLEEAESRADVATQVAQTVVDLAKQQQSSVISLSSMREALAKARAEKDEKSAIEIARQQAEQAREL